MNPGIIDDNGNPCTDPDNPDYQVHAQPLLKDSVELESSSSNPPMEGSGSDTHPKCFINAAELSEEDVYPVKENAPKLDAGPKRNSEIKPPTRPRSRVPVSKSYPDIIQTTFGHEPKETPQVLQQSCFVPTMTKQPSDLESLIVADSLENLGPGPKDRDSCEQVVQRPDPDDRPIRPSLEQPPLKSGIMNSSALMTESQMCGILGEKAPESWTIDLNSLSMTSDLTTSTRGENRSGPNSLSFFVNMTPKPEEEERSESLSTSTGPERKIFSMFVDLKDNIGPTPKSLKPPSSKPLVDLRESTCSKKKFPSPIFAHKAAAEDARARARSDWEKQREKYFDSLEPSAILAMMEGQSSDPTLSNRSSLHVANVLDGSFSSSILSSMEASELEQCSGGPCLKLQLDLTRMFQEGINTDVVISVGGKWIRAHKCILASRSQYFAAILSGHWVEKAGNTINLDGYSYSVVQFALYHIYSGTNEIPDSIDLLELASLTDLLGLEGLRENISQTFRVKFCHNFHRPCTGCITGVLECFPIAGNYGMDELHRKMIKWIARHFVRIWPTKGFASLGHDLIEKCLNYSINHLSVDNILDHTLGCDQLTTTMPSLRWTETIFTIVSTLAEACTTFVGENLSDVLQSQKFLQFGKGQAWNISRIETTFLSAMTLLKPDIACLSHTALVRLIELGTETLDEVEWSAGFVDFLNILRDEVEKYLYANASKAVLSRCWEELGAAFRKKICSSSFVGYDKFGNKIVKSSTPTGASSTGKSSRQQGVVTSARGTSSKLVSSGSVSHSSAKVASVRPMQSQAKPTQPEVPVQPVPQPRTLSNVGRSATMSSTKSDASESSTRPATAASRPRPSAASVDKSRRTSVSASSPSRTPKQPLTPSGGPSPLLGQESKPKRPLPGSATARNHALARAASKPPPEPPKKTFLSNSAKAAAVSKPNLKPKKIPTPTSSLGSVSSGGGAGGYSPTGGVSRQNSKPGSGSGARTNTAAIREKEGSFSARNSFSRVERPVSSSTPGRGQAAHVTKFSQKATPIGRNVQRPTSSVAATTAARKPVSAKGGCRGGHSKAPGHDFESFSSEFQPDSLMSRSTIETESSGGDVKMRTLAEIGRSSTFNKDEPTILGKMESSGYGGDYQDDSFEDDEDYD